MIFLRLLPWQQLVKSFGLFPAPDKHLIQD